MTLDGETDAIYYAENIAGGANTVTVSDNLSAGTLRFSIMEYSGVALTNSFDNAVVAEGSGTSPSTPNAPTSWGGDLLLGEIVTAIPPLSRRVPLQDRRFCSRRAEHQGDWGGPNPIHRGKRLCECDDWRLR